MSARDPMGHERSRAHRGEAPSAEYRAWFALGWPAFLAVIAILVPMIAKPS